MRHMTRPVRAAGLARFGRVIAAPASKPQDHHAIRSRRGCAVLAHGRVYGNQA